MVMNGHLRKAGLPYIPEDLAVAYAESLRVYAPGNGTNIKKSVEYLEAFGAKAKLMPSNLKAIKAALNRGLQVNLGAGKHGLRITEIRTELDSSTWVFFEDSWNGSLSKMKARDFCDIVDKDALGGFKDVMFVDLKGVTKGKGPFILNPDK